MTGTGVIDQFLETFTRYIDNGFGLLGGDVGYTFIYDPDLLATGLYHPAGGFNFGRSNNSQAIALIEAGRRETDIDKRQKIYWELEKVLTEAHEDAWLWWEEGAVAMRKNVMGWDNEKWKKDKESYSLSHPLWFKEGKQS
jgi:ABC-type transport system substrate-binding protein